MVVAINVVVVAVAVADAAVLDNVVVVAHNIAPKHTYQQQTRPPHFYHHRIVKFRIYFDVLFLFYYWPITYNMYFMLKALLKILNY